MHKLDTFWGMVLWATSFGTILKFIVDSIWSSVGQINTCVFPTGHPGYALCSYVLYTGLEYPAKIEEKLSQHDIASYTAKG